MIDVLNKALSVHALNQSELQYLWDYYRGKTPILGKTKEFRENINHKINVNRANEIVNFKLGYGFGEPIQYIRRGSDESLADDMTLLNEAMFVEKKQSKDKALAEWIYIGGVGVRMVLPGDSAERPFRIYELDPRYSFNVYYNGLGEDVKMGVKFIVKENQTTVYSVYTDKWYFEIENGVITKESGHVLGEVPVFEYQANKARMGAFEPILSLLDAISELESNRMDDVVQFVNSILTIVGGSIDSETAAKLEELKMLCLPEGVEAKYLSTSMQQADVQTQADNLWDMALTIVGIPNRNGGSSTSDTGSAVIMRDGWSDAEAQMKGVEQEYKDAEENMLRLILRIMRDMVGVKLLSKDIAIKFSRRNYENIQTKSQVLVSMLNNPKIDPYLAFVHCGLFLDPEGAYLQSKEYWEENEKKAAEDKANDTDPVS